MNDIHAAVLAEIDAQFTGRFGLKRAETALREVVALHAPWDVDNDEWRCTTCRDRHSGQAAPAPCGELKTIARALGVVIPT